MQSYLLPLEKVFEQHADKTRATGTKAYLLNQFEFYGIPMTERRKMCKDFIKTNSLSSISEVEKIVKEAWKQPEREWQYFAIELLEHYKKAMETINHKHYRILHHT